MKYAYVLLPSAWLLCVAAGSSLAGECPGFGIVGDHVFAEQARASMAMTAGRTFDRAWTTRHNAPAHILLRQLGSDGFPVGSAYPRFQDGMVAAPPGPVTVGPAMRLSVDTVRLRASTGLDLPVNTSFSVVSDTAAGGPWSASESAEWLGLSTYTGRAGEQVEIRADASALAAGNYHAPVAIDGRDTLWVLLEVVDDLPYLEETPTGIESKSSQDPPLPAAFQLSQNYPNPFNSETVIEFDLPARSAVQLEAFNILGQRARLLADGDLPPGHHRVAWDGLLESGREAPSGIYFYRLRSADVSLVRKMVLLR